MSFAEVHCPYCGERIELSVDASVESQQYIEDCQVCCRPIEVDAQVDRNGEISVRTRAENDSESF